jgi:hypothetical protein
VSDDPIGEPPVPTVPPHLAEVPPLDDVDEHPGARPAKSRQANGNGPSFDRLILLGSSPGYLSTVALVRSDAFRQVICAGQKLEYNSMAARPELGRQRIEDHTVNSIREAVEREFCYQPAGNKATRGYQVKPEDLWSAIDQVAHEKPYHPVADYLRGLEWDKVPRIDRFAVQVLGMDDPSALQHTLIRMWFIGAAARGTCPGCKSECAFIIQGKQGTGKTRLFETLGGKWYLSFAGDFEHRDSRQQLAERWIIEFSELESIRGKAVTKFKSFMSLREDTWVAKYERSPRHVPRSYSVVGTTNEEHFLEDPTGNRRFWIIPAGRINVDLAREWRDQLWAEAMALLGDRGSNELDTETGSQWWLDEKSDADLHELQAAYEHQDAWHDIVVSWADDIDGIEPITTAGALGGPLDKKPGLWTRGDEMRIASIFRKSGRYPVKRRIGNKTLNTWCSIRSNPSVSKDGGSDRT